jgi:hypothetical protein
MGRTELLKQLDQVDQQVWHAAEQVDRQRKVLTELDAQRADTNEAQLLLSRLENLLIFRLQERERLRDDLSRAGPL